MIAPDVELGFLSQIHGDMLNESHTVYEEMEELGDDAYYSIVKDHKIIDIGWMKLDDIIKKIICQI